MDKKKRLKRSSDKRRRQIANAEKRLMKKAASQQRKLNRFIRGLYLDSLDIKDGRVSASKLNRQKVGQSKELRNYIRGIIDRELLGFYKEEFEKIERGSKSYYNQLGANEVTHISVMDVAQDKKDVFLNDLFDNNNFEKAIRQTITNAINTNQTKANLEKTLTEQIKGTDNKLGMIESYHYREGKAEFSAYSRTIQNGYKTNLNLNYAIYQGGEIATTRSFCDARNGKVFNLEEILAMNNLTWQGKKDNHNILIDCGGYNCRHDWDWISFELAQELRPSIKKSKYDN